MRITLDNEEVAAVIVALEASNFPQSSEIAAKIREQAMRPPHPAKQTATGKATEVKMQRAKEAITNAVNLMRLEGRKITAYSVAKRAGISYNTAKKYGYLYQTDIT